MSSSDNTKAALIIIDVQASFTQMPYWSEQELPAFQAALQRLEAGCRARGVPVVHIFHVEDSAPFSLASGWVKPLPWLDQAPSVRFDKHTHNAFTDTGLDLWLRRQGIGRLLISGIRTEQCCETTTRVGSDLGYKVDFVTEATMTFPMTHAGTGQTFSADEIKVRSELVLANRFARITTVDDCLARLPAPL
jgi:nicotinamidase-related amidase